MRWGLYLLGCLICLGFIATGLQHQEEQAFNSTDQLNPCDLREGQTGIIRGRVVETHPMSAGYSAQGMRTILSNDCRVTVVGNEFKLREMGFQEGVKFQATVAGGFLTNPKGIQKDRTVDGENYPFLEVNVSHKPQFRHYEKEADWEIQVVDPERRLIISVWLKISRAQANQLQKGRTYRVYFNPEDNKRVVELQQM